MQTGTFTPKPTDDEIARVVAWQKVFLDPAINRAAEAYFDLRCRVFMGQQIDERFSKKALIGLIYFTEANRP